MSQDEHPPPPPLAIGQGSTPVAGLDHAWVVESMDQQYSLGLSADGSSLWVARVRCVHCQLRVDFWAADVPPCRPQGEPSPSH